MIVQCPSCGQQYRARGWEFGTEGWDAKIYTDGRIENFGEDVPLNFYCRRCDRFWARGRVNESLEDRAIPWRKLIRIPMKKAPSASRLAELAGSDLSNLAGGEQSLRLEAWRMSNDRFRNRFDCLKPKPDSRPTWWHDNMQALSRLLRPDDPEDILALIEVHRELGEFETCISLAGRIDLPRAADPFDPEVDAYRPCVDMIRQLAQKRNPHVRCCYEDHSD